MPKSKISAYLSILCDVSDYLLTWNLFHPSRRYATVCSAAATPALKFASAVCAPIFLGVKNTRAPKSFSYSSAIAGLMSLT